MMEYLKKGDLVAVVSPAGKTMPSQVLPAISWLRERGYQLWQGNFMVGSHFQYAGTDTERLSDLQEALDNPQVKAIIFARGGYGTIRLVERLNFGEFVKYPKWLSGYSDITILHNICHNLGLPSVHGAMLKGALDETGTPSNSFMAMIKTLEGEKPRYGFGVHQQNRTGEATAVLTGGNLSLLYSLLGTPHDIDTRNKILFIEEIGEYLYHIDRMMISLKLAGKLDHLKGLVIGQFSDVKDNREPFGKSVEEIISETVAGFHYPVCFGFQAGHDKINWPLVFGKTCNLRVASDGSFLTEI